MPVQFEEEAFAGLSANECEDLLRKAAVAFNPDVLGAHFDAVQDKPNDPEYLESKGGKPVFVNTGEAESAIRDPEHRFKKIDVMREADGYRVTVGLHRIKDGLNVYSIAQAGGREISANRDGDEEIVEPHLQQAIVDHLEKRGIL